MKTLLTIALIISVCISDGFSSEVENRRKQTLQNIEKYEFHHKNPIRAKMVKSAYDAVSSSTAKTLEKPSIVYSLLVSDTNQVFRLHLCWIEKYPSVDSFEFSYKKDSTIVVQLSDNEINQLKEQAKQVVSFNTGARWEGDTKNAQELTKVQSAKELKIRLLKSNSPVTDWVSVEYNKLGQWIK